MVGDHKRGDVQRNFLKYTGQQLLKLLKQEGSNLQSDLLVQTSDRKYQVWERNSLGVVLWSQDVFMQKLNYINDNPVRAGLCEYAEDYKYSSARFYILNEKAKDFISHYNG